MQSDNRARMMRQTDPYLRERLHDLDELANRLLHRLVGRDMVGGQAALPDNAILVARSMGPAALLDYDRSRLRGLVLEEGGPTSHVAIVARALGIPAVGNVENVTSLAETGDAIIVDGGVGQVHLRPQPDVEAAFREKARLRARRQEQYRKLRDLPGVTRDGVAVALHLNAGLLVDLPHLEETGADGIGLFRTELQFMIAERLPSIERAARRSTGRSGGGGRAAGHLPHARHRRRQGAALHAPGRRGEPGARLARDPHRPRPAGPAARAGARPAEGGRRARDQDHVADGRHGGRVPPRQGASSARERAHLDRHGYDAAAATSSSA